MVSNKELRSRAKQTLGKNIFSSQWMYALVASLIINTIAGITSALLIGLLITGILTIGLCKYYLGISRNISKYDNIYPLAEGLKTDPMGNLVLGLLVNVFTFLWSLLFVIPGIVKAYSYSMAFYIKCDHPEYSATQAIDESRKIMHGNKWKLFMLDLSFLGWAILAAFTFGIGTLWLTPYQTAARTEFYLDLIDETPKLETSDQE